MTDNNTPVLEVKHLRKKYKNLVAVDDISFAIPAGICFGLLGPNGAGKTTTIEMIEGITPPTSGEILYQGRPRGKNFALEAGIQFQATSVMERLTCIEILRLFHSLYPNTVDLDELVVMCDLEGFLTQEATRLSGGQQQRLMFALALINNPEIIFLDEPTTGLDPQSRRNLWKLIERVKAAGKSLILTTHYMDEAEILCDHLAIVDHGRIIAEGSPADLLKKHFDCFYVTLDKRDCQALLVGSEGADGEASDGERSDGIGKIDFAEKAVEKNGQIEIHSRSVEQTLQHLIASGVNLSSLQVRHPTLEDLFIELTGHQLRE